MFRYKSKYKKVGVLTIWKVKSNETLTRNKTLTRNEMLTRNETLTRNEPTLEMLNFTFHIGSTPAFLYFDLRHTVYTGTLSFQLAMFCCVLLCNAEVVTKAKNKIKNKQKHISWEFHSQWCIIIPFITYTELKEILGTLRSTTRQLDDAAFKTK